MTHPKWKNSVCYILWKFYTSKVLYICCYLGWHVCRDWQNKFSVGMTELQTKPQNFQTLRLLLEGEWMGKKKKKGGCFSALLKCCLTEQYARKTLQFCLICNRRGVYLCRGTFPHNNANYKQNLATFLLRFLLIQGSGKGQKVQFLVWLLHILSESCLLKLSLRSAPASLFSVSKPFSWWG